MLYTIDQKMRKRAENGLFYLGGIVGFSLTTHLVRQLPEQDIKSPEIEIVLLYTTVIFGNGYLASIVALLFPTHRPVGIVLGNIWEGAWRCVEAITS